VVLLVIRREIEGKEKLRAILSAPNNRRHFRRLGGIVNSSIWNIDPRIGKSSSRIQKTDIIVPERLRESKPG